MVGEGRPTAGTCVHGLVGKKVPRNKMLRCDEGYAPWLLGTPADHNGGPKGIMAEKGHREVQEYCLVWLGSSEWCEERAEENQTFHSSGRMHGQPEQEGHQRTRQNVKKPLFLL